MNEPKDVERAGTPAVAVQRFVSSHCEWMIGRWQDHQTCGEPAQWQWQNGRWKLCDHHKQRLLESYNTAWRAQETPEWIRI